MKKITLLTLLLTSSISLAADGPTLKNGDFEKGKLGWDGGGKATTLPEGGRVASLKPSKRSPDSLAQELDFGDAKQVKITFRARSVKYNGLGFRISLRAPRGGGTFRDRELPQDGSWQNLEVVFARGNAPKLVLEFTALDGDGEIQVDDVKVTAEELTLKPGQ
jgi:hypothetical protein